MASVDDKVRNWLMSERPGLVEAPTPAEVLRKAWGMSKLECGVSDFESALARAGFRVDVVQGRYRLALPARSVQVSDNYRALRHIEG